MMTKGKDGAKASPVSGIRIAASSEFVEGLPLSFHSLLTECSSSSSSFFSTEYSSSSCFSTESSTSSLFLFLSPSLSWQRSAEWLRRTGMHTCIPFLAYHRLQSGHASRRFLGSTLSVGTSTNLFCFINKDIVDVPKSGNTPIVRKTSSNNSG